MTQNHGQKVLAVLLREPEAASEQVRSTPGLQLALGKVPGRENMGLS